MEKLNAVFPITSYSEIAKAINYLNSNHSKAIAEGKPLVVRISTKQDDRSAAQNRLYFKWLEQISQKTGNSKDDMHFFYKKKYLAGIYVANRQDTAEKHRALISFRNVKQHFGGLERQKLDADYEMLVNIFITDHIQSRKATIKEFTQYLDKINIHAHRDLGVMLVIPDDLKWCYKPNEV
ncbi:hypothetical protein [Acinetobacter higginsii]|uniref:hypothetical protein n=1 Tax=Acinetobacter higginsii TaxID=70347 RepID=UPI001F4AEE80|nr:hypothetical protein [Acinetobacter higginsii]MCH7381387.1 hypothetical protein [Acinetobacter higginsii]